MKRKQFYVIQMPMNILARDESRLRVESASGRALILPILSLFLFMFGATFGVAALLVSIVVWTFSEVWTLDRKGQQIRREFFLLLTPISSVQISYDSLSELAIRKKEFGVEGTFFTMEVCLSEGRSYYITSRRRIEDLNHLLDSFKKYLPPNLSIRHRDEYGDYEPET